MNLGKTVFLSTAALILLLLNVPVFGQVTVDPIGISVVMENEDTLTVEMTLTNSGEDD